MARLDSEPPVRKIGMNRRSLTGNVNLSDDSESADFESSLERDWLICLDFDRDVLEIKVQPIVIEYEVDGVLRTYTPDTKATYGKLTGRTRVVLYEVKYREDLRKDWASLKRRFKAARRYCKERGWEFEIMTEREIRTPFLVNAQFLRKYLSVPDNDITRGQLLYTLSALGETSPEGLLAASYWCTEHRMQALPMVWKMLAQGVIQGVLHQPLNMKTPIWRGEQ